MTDTGLPELPKGYFWRVAEYLNSRGKRQGYAVKLMRKTWWGSKTESQRRIMKSIQREVTRYSYFTEEPYNDVQTHTSYPDPTPENIFSTADSLLADWNTQRDYARVAAERAAKTAALLGDYPPKTLNNTEE